MRPFLVALALVTTGATTLAAQQPTAPARPACCAADTAPKPCPMMQGMQHDGGGMGMQHQGGGMGMDHGAGGHASFVDLSRAGRGDGYVMSLGVLGERS